MSIANIQSTCCPNCTMKRKTRDVADGESDIIRLNITGRVKEYIAIIISSGQVSDVAVGRNEVAVVVEGECCGSGEGAKSHVFGVVTVVDVLDAV